jgi:DNA repair exonuclease SbcCD ATPase subunit
LPNDEADRTPGGRTPIPDPTFLTTQNLLREVTGLREYLESRIESMEDVQNEKHIQAEQQFALVERQRVEQKKDTKDAVDAALTAQKEAVREQTAASERAIAKSEAATSKQLDQLSITFTTAISSIQRELGEMKERVTTIEQRKEGSRETTAGLYTLVGVLSTILFVGLAVVGLVATR